MRGEKEAGEPWLGISRPPLSEPQFTHLCCDSQATSGEALEMGRVSAPGRLGKDLMPMGPSLQVASGWHPELQPGADHAERRRTPDQPGR